MGGGHGFDDRLPVNSLLSLNASARLNEGICLHRQLPNSKLVFSGSTTTPGRTTQAEMLKKAALLLDVDEEAIILQTESEILYIQAEVYAENYGHTFHLSILDTSAAHMPRAAKIFNNY